MSFCWVHPFEWFGFPTEHVRLEDRWGQLAVAECSVRRRPRRPQLFCFSTKAVTSNGTTNCMSTSTKGATIKRPPSQALKRFWRLATASSVSRHGVSSLRAFQGPGCVTGAFARAQKRVPEQQTWSLVNFATKPTAFLGVGGTLGSSEASSKSLDTPKDSNSLQAVDGWLCYASERRTW